MTQGEDAVFTAEAKIESSYSKELKYIWLDSTDVDPDAELSLKDIIALIGKAVGKEKTLVLKNVSTTDSGSKYKCIAYCGGLRLAMKLRSPLGERPRARSIRLRR